MTALRAHHHHSKLQLRLAIKKEADWPLISIAMQIRQTPVCSLWLLIVLQKLSKPPQNSRMRQLKPARVKQKFPAPRNQSLTLTQPPMRKAVESQHGQYDDNVLPSKRESWYLKSANSDRQIRNLSKYRTEHRQHKCNICSASHVTRNRQHDAKSAP